jgi:hypothetical protein
VAGLSWSWLSVLFGITALIYGSAPYNFSVFQIGLLFIGGVAVSLLAFISGPLSDWTCKFLARHNRGIYEPEVSKNFFLSETHGQFRLVPMVFSFIFGTMGFLGLGISLHRQMYWIFPVIFELSIIFGLQFVNVSTYGYISDCLRDHTAEAFASLTITKLYEFGMTVQC